MNLTVKFWRLFFYFIWIL